MKTNSYNSPFWPDWLIPNSVEEKVQKGYYDVDAISKLGKYALGYADYFIGQDGESHDFLGIENMLGTKTQYPSAVTVDDGYKTSSFIKDNQYMSGRQKNKKNKNAMPSRGRFRGRGRGRGRGRVPRIGRGRLPGNKPARVSFRSNGLKLPGGGRIVKAALNTAVAGMRQHSSMLGTRPNCIRIKTRFYLGTLSLATNSNSDMTIGGVTNHGQWYFNPGNGAYFPSNVNVLTLCRMFQKYMINSCKFIFKSLMTPGLVTSYRIIYGFVEDINLGETFISGFNTGQTLSKANILQLPDASDFPAWTPEWTIAPPVRWFRNKKFDIRGNDLNQLNGTGSSSGNVALSKMVYAFGLWMMVDGLAPGAELPISDIFVDLDIELCDIAPLMIYDATGGSTFSSPSTEIKNVPSTLSGPTLNSMVNTNTVSTVRDLKRELKENDYNAYATLLPSERKRFLDMFDRMKVADDYDYVDERSEPGSDTKSQVIKSSSNK